MDRECRVVAVVLAALLLGGCGDAGGPTAEPQAQRSGEAMPSGKTGRI